MPAGETGNDGRGDALRIDTVEVASGLVGLVHCPGRSGTDGTGQRWQRDLNEDLAALEAWGATVVVSLLEVHEFEALGVPEFAAAVRARRFAWHHVPIPDMQTPGPVAAAAWQRSGRHVLQALNRGERVVFHCAAGLGRSGMLVAKLLADLGMPPPEAIALVRRRRPGAIETAAQEAFVADSAPFTQMESS